MLKQSRFVKVQNLQMGIALSRGAKSTLTFQQLDALHDQVVFAAYRYQKQQSHDLQVENNVLEKCLSGSQAEEEKPSWLKRIGQFALTSLVLGTAVMLFHKVVEIMFEKKLEKAANWTLATLSEILNLTGGFLAELL